MSQRNIESKRHKAKSYDQKEISSSQHSKFKKSMADQLRAEMYILMQKQKIPKDEAWKSVEEHERFKAKGNLFESEAEFHWKAYRMWSDEVHRLGNEILVKLKAVQKFETPSMNMEEAEINDKKQYMKYINNKKKQQMKYGPSDED